MQGYKATLTHCQPTQLGMQLAQPPHHSLCSMHHLAADRWRVCSMLAPPQYPSRTAPGCRTAHGCMHAISAAADAVHASGCTREHPSHAGCFACCCWRRLNPHDCKRAVAFGSIPAPGATPARCPPHFQRKMKPPRPLPFPAPCDHKAAICWLQEALATQGRTTQLQCLVAIQPFQGHASIPRPDSHTQLLLATKALVDLWQLPAGCCRGWLHQHAPLGSAATELRS